jgi:dephospho-CoA kinase
MLKIGVTGNMGSGKTTVCRIFEHLGIAVYYSDAKAKQFYGVPAVKQEIQSLFGDSVFDAAGNIDTRNLARLVFQDENKLQALNRFVHPLVIDDFQKWCQEHKNQHFVLFESALSYQCGLEKLFDKIIFVDAPVELLLQRCSQRGNTEMVKQRLENQQRNYDKRHLADFVIYNDEKQSLIGEVVGIKEKIVSLQTLKKI